MGRKKLSIDSKQALAELSSSNISELLIDDVNETIGKFAFALGEEEAPTDILDFISTGSTILDTILTNGKWNEKTGWPVRRLVEISGNTSSGKSLLANHALINTQKMGGVPILFDEENTTDISLLVKMGLKIGKFAEEAGVNKLVYLQAGTVENVFDTMEKIILKTREIDKNKLITIVWDSIAATPTKDEIDGEFDQEGYGTGKAKTISKAMRKITKFIGHENVCLIFTNQLRDSIGKFGFGDKQSTPGGWAVPFHSSIRLRLSKLSDIKKNDVTVGVTVQAHTKKNKIAPFNRKCTFDIYFDKGIDDEQSWFDNLIEKNVIKRPTKQMYSISINGTEHTFKSSKWLDLLSDENIRNECRKLVINANVIDYSALTQNIDSNFDIGEKPTLGEEEVSVDVD